MNQTIINKNKWKKRKGKKERKEKKVISKISVDSNFMFTTYALCALALTTVLNKILAD